ncbi:hypothetical protein BDD14_4066 [Edaphobacter modestus]|uniref:Uncharacterized protein n=1 Tax=Edaphobacter modestus TaxID=388466 RepID=A0A4V2G522_9BACT|nr:hypothetical protein BDD14_4066 [Edaphobacter modestus]
MKEKSRAQKMMGGAVAQWLISERNSSKEGRIETNAIPKENENLKQTKIGRRRGKRRRKTAQRFHSQRNAAIQSSNITSDSISKKPEVVIQFSRKHQSNSQR